MDNLLSVFLVRSTEEEERSRELRFVAAKTEEEALRMTIGTFDYGDTPKSVTKTEMLYSGEPKILHSIYLD